MKKIIILLLLLLISSSLMSCFGNRNPKYWGETYGKEELIDGFRVCLRNDGYYQIIGVRDKAFKNDYYIVPQYINNIPVMGYGIPAFFTRDELYRYLYKEKKSFPYDYSGRSSVLTTDINGKDLFSESIVGVKKAYICCHHVNGSLSYCRNWTYEGISTMINFSINNLNPEHFFAFYTSNGIPETKILYYFCYEDYIQYDSIIEKHINNEELIRERLEMGFATPIDCMCCNIEFHYNLFIDGVEYHSFTHPENDIYWIDYVDNSEKLMEPPIPYVEGHKFLGWYKDKECTIPYNFTTEVVHEVENEFVWLNLYAKWEQSI